MLKGAAKVEAFNVQSAWNAGRLTTPAVTCQALRLRKGRFQDPCVSVRAATEMAFTLEGNLQSV